MAEQCAATDESACSSASLDGRQSTCAATGKCSYIFPVYEACEPEAQLRLRLSGTLNATLAARRSAVAAPLPILAVIYFGTHHERLHAVRAYERYFRRLVYMSPNREIVRAVGKLRSRGSSSAEVHAHHCTRWIKATYMCVASVAPALMDGLRGVLYMHFDLWLQPWALRALQHRPAWRGELVAALGGEYGSTKVEHATLDATTATSLAGTTTAITTTCVT